MGDFVVDTASFFLSSGMGSALEQTSLLLGYGPRVYSGCYRHRGPRGGSCRTPPDHEGMAEFKGPAFFSDHISFVQCCCGSSANSLRRSLGKFLPCVVLHLSALGRHCPCPGTQTSASLVVQRIIFIFAVDGAKCIFMVYSHCTTLKVYLLHIWVMTLFSLFLNSFPGFLVAFFFLIYFIKLQK